MSLSLIHLKSLSISLTLRRRKLQWKSTLPRRRGLNWKRKREDKRNVRKLFREITWVRED